MIGFYNGKNKLIVKELYTELKLELKYEDLIAYNSTTKSIITNYKFDIKTTDISHYKINFDNKKLC